MTDLSTFAQSEFARLAEKAAIDVANRPALRDRAERNLRCWLSIAVRLGADPAPARALLADAAQCFEGWTPAQQRTVAADWIAPRADCQKALTHARDLALTAAEAAATPEITARWRGLRTLAAHFGAAPIAPAATPERIAA